MSNTGAVEYVNTLANKFRSLSVEDLEVLAGRQYLSDKDNSDLLFQGAMQALQKKSPTGCERTYNRIAMWEDNRRHDKFSAE